MDGHDESPAARFDRRRFLALVGGGAAVSIVLAACGGDDGESAGPTSTSEPSPPVTLADDGDPTFITRLDSTGEGLRLAVKDLIDVAGVVTTAGCAAVASGAQPARADAACLAGARAAGVRLVGKTNLSELAYSPTGVNDEYGTPVNPGDASLIPGGSSSGSAVAVATGAADVAFGSDTAGSIRIPAACCGVAGLKTTFGRIPVDGVRPLAPSFDVVGPLAADIDGLVRGMQLLEPSFTPAESRPVVVGRVRRLLDDYPLALDVDPRLDEAVDSALAQAGFEVVELDLVLPAAAVVAFSKILYSEATAVNEPLLSEPDLLGPGTAASIEAGRSYTEAEIDAARRTLDAWARDVDRAFELVEMLALPTLAVFPPTLRAVASDAGMTPTGVSAQLPALTSPWSAALLPALALPISAGAVPASLQLVGSADTEELLLAAGATVEAAVR